MRLLHLSTVFGLVLVAATAGRSRAAGPDFETAVRPVLAEHCLKCHGPEKQRGGLRVDSRAALLSGGDSGPALVPGKPAESLFIQALHHTDLEMPPANPLPAETIDLLSRWVESGAPWGGAGGESEPVAKSATRKPGQITDADRAWWAFRAPVRPAVPDAGGGWARTPIDRFVAERLESHKLSPAPEADRATLIRRVTFDLTGLPPTPSEIDAFVADRSPDAYGALVDRLLASPAYGERQARMWLDLVRYGESDGYRADGPRPSAWRYRDYVVRSFNADKGYDRFLREQLAGDETDPANPDALVATGYLRLWQYEYNQRDVRTQHDAILTDITDVSADVFLGLGMGCARCHDHKFDPILQKDYFALQAFFAGLSFPDEPVFDTPEARADHDRLSAEYDAQTAPTHKRLDELLAPGVAAGTTLITSRFPPDIQAVVNKPAAERTPTEQRLAELALVQIRFFAERDSTKGLTKPQKAEYDELQARLKAVLPPPSPLAMVARDIGPVAAETRIPNSRKHPAPVDPAFPVVLGADPPAVTPGDSSTGRRAALAAWLTRPDHPLTARVLVNRLWQGHFGTGLVETPSDFGTLGSPPSHPALLDWLAVEFVERGWSVKHLHRLVVTSAAYRQAATRPPAAALAVDPDNRLLSRWKPRRLDAEQVRDALLAVSGELRPEAGGPGTPPQSPRRTVYTAVMRNSQDPLLAAFDAADAVTSCSRRNLTTTPTQSLLLLNDPQMLRRAQAFARRVMPPTGAGIDHGVTAAYRLAYGCAPSAEELAWCKGFLRQQVGVGTGVTVTPERRLAAWADFCHVIFNTNEFLYID